MGEGTATHRADRARSKPATRSTVRRVRTMSTRLRPIAVIGLVTAALFAGACGQSTATITESVSAPSTPESPEPVPESGPVAGRVALGAAQGEPHVLWFWGAH